MSSSDFVEMRELPEGMGLSESICGIIHGNPYAIIMDGLDTSIFQKSSNGDLKLLCQLNGSEVTRRFAISLMRAAELQREAELTRKNK